MHSDKIFWKLCLEDVKKNRGDQTVLNVSKMAKFSSQTLTGNLNVHLTTQHGLEIWPDNKATKIVDYFRQSIVQIIK